MAAKKKVAKKKVVKKAAKKSKAVRSVVEVLLKSLQVEENSIGDGQVYGLIKFAWKYPKPGKAILETVVPFSGLGDGKQGKIDFTSLPYDLASRYLFKYHPEGRSVISVEVAITQRPGLVSKMLSSILNKSISAVSNPLLGASLDILLDSAGLTKEKIRVIGRTSFEIPASPKTESLHSTLIIPEAFNVYKLSRTHSEWDDDGIDDYDDVTFKAGEANGRVTIEVITE